MAADEKWYFTKEQIQCAPSRKYGYDVDKELSCRQQAANFIQDMGQRLQVTQLCINTAIVYMHRFYMFHSFSRFHRNNMAAAALFLAAKVEEQPRKLEHVIKVSQICLHRDVAPPDVKSEASVPHSVSSPYYLFPRNSTTEQSYMEQAQELVVNENILLQTLGFDVGIDHPHTHVVRCCQLVRASKDLAQTSYFMASNSLHLTTMCLQYKPTVVACFCIHLACKWSNWEIPQSTEGKPWFWYIDKTVTQELLEQLTEEFLAIFEKCPSRLKKKIVSLSQNQNVTILSQFNSNKDDKKRNGEGSSAGLFPTGCSLSTAEEMKKKQEFQRHHPEYKKHHMSTHHNRPDPANVSSKSSCMFGPPQRTQPSSHSSVSSSHQSRSISKSAAPDGSNIGKPEHLHHRPRRPEEKHPRNHDHVPPPYKKFDGKVPGGAANEFPPPGPNPNSRSGMYNTTTPSSYQMAQQMAPQVMHPPAPPEQNLPVPPQPSAPKIAPIPPRVKTPPPPIKIERSIFSPEKCTPPPESIIKPLPPTPPPVNPAPNFFQKIAIKEEPVVKLEPIAPIEVKQEISISPKEEKPPDLSAPVEQPAPVEVPIAPSQSQPEEHTSHKEKKHKKEKKKHKEHKEKHKDKHKHKHKNREPEQTQQRAGEGLSLVIKIPKEQINLTPQPDPLKIKISRDKITTPKMPVESPLKIKISQGKIKDSKKRDRSEERSPGLPAKYHRPNGTTTLQVKAVELVNCANIKQEYDNVEVHSPPSVQFDQQDLGGNLVHSPPPINFDSHLVKQEFDIHSPPSVAHSPPSVGTETKLDFGVPQILSPPSVNLEPVDSPPLPNLESEFKVIKCTSPLNVKREFEENKRPPSVNERRTVDGVTVEVHSPPSISFDDMDTGEEMSVSSPHRPSEVKPDLKIKTEVIRKNSPLEAEKNMVVVKAENVADDRRNVGSHNQWNRFSEEYKPNFTGRGGILYRARARGVYRPPRGGVLYRNPGPRVGDFPNRQWTPRPADSFRGGYRQGYNQQPRTTVRHQLQHQARPSQPRPPRMTSRVSYPQHQYTTPQMTPNQYPEHLNRTLQYVEQQQQYVEQQQHFAEQQHYTTQHYAQLQQHYYHAQQAQALYVSQFTQPPPASGKIPPPLPDGPPPDIPPPPPPPE